MQSSRLADARIDYYGRGVVSDKTNVPLFHRNWIVAVRGRMALSQTAPGNEVPFYLKEGQPAEMLKLGLTFEGPGTVWVKEIRVFQTPLEA